MIMYQGYPMAFTTAISLLVVGFGRLICQSIVGMAFFKRTAAVERLDFSTTIVQRQLEQFCHVVDLWNSSKFCHATYPLRYVTFDIPKMNLNGTFDLSIFYPPSSTAARPFLHWSPAAKRYS